LHCRSIVVSLETAMSISLRLSNYLLQNSARYQVCPHNHSRSSAETARLAHVPEHQLAKSVMLEDERGCVLAVVPADTRVQLGTLARLLGRPDLRLSDETKIATLFDDCELGAVPAFGMVWGLETIVDDELERNLEVYVESGDHERLLRLSSEQFSNLMGTSRRGSFTRSVAHH
jgi:Ala-tRNA(Pro) deacylase